MKPNDVSMPGVGAPKEGRYIITFKNGKSKENFIKDRNKNNKVKKNFGKQAALAAILTDAEVAELSANSEILYIEPDSAVEMLSVGKPDKTDKAVKNMEKHGQNVPWGIASIGAASTLHKYDGKKVKVAVFDTGISNHEDLTISGGVSFVDYTDSYSDDNGHGTHVAGTIAANNNKIGVVGVAPDAEIYAVKILDNSGKGSYSGIISALEWAIDNDIEIINMSLGSSQFSSVLHDAVKQAVDAGIIIVAAAGNQGEGEDTVLYPAKYPEVVAVGALTEQYKAAAFSSRGLGLNIVAPGLSVLSTLNDGDYAAMSGTSMAAPHVSGALAALKSKNKKLGSVELINRIYETATPLGDYSTYGCGFLNFAYAAGEVDGSVISVSADDTPVCDGKGNDDNDVNENIIIYAPESEFAENKGSRRERYEQLLYGDYYAGELKVNFKELFGDYTPEYIETNYTEIFDITPEEVDIGIIELLVYSDKKGGELTIQSLFEIEKTAFESSVNFAAANGYPTITNISKTNTSISFDVAYTNSGDINNILVSYDRLNQVYLLGRDGKPTGTNQRITVKDLIPGVEYVFTASAWNNAWLDTEIKYLVPFPAENMQSYTKTNMTFKLDKWFADSFSSGRLDAFFNKCDTAYNKQLDLVGGNKPYNGDKMGFETSKTLPEGVEGYSGQPITWSIYTKGNGIPTIHHVLTMNKLNVSMTETPIHEIGHNFDKSKWTFEAEALTIFKIYHYMHSTGDSMTVAGFGQVISGAAGYKTYIKSHANRMSGHINYDAAMAQGAYSPYGLAYNLANMADAVGWEAVKQTFRYFDSLAANSIPNTSLGKLNLFLTKLRDFSPGGNVDVIGKLTLQEKSIYKTKFGGTIEYINTGNIYTDDHANDIWNGTMLTLNMPIDGVINYAGDIDCFKFIAPITTKYMIYSGGNTPLAMQQMWKLLPSGSASSVSPLFTDSASNFKKVYELEKDTTYMFGVAHTNAAATSGNYTVAVKYDDGSIGDHSSDKWNGTWLKENQPMPGKINGAGDVDCFRFIPTTTGRYILFSEGSAPMNLKQAWELRSDGKAWTISPLFTDSTKTFKKVYEFTAGATYYFEVTHTNAATTSGDYSVTMIKDDGSVNDHSDSIWNGTMLTLDASMSGKINYAGDVDCFKFIPPTTGKYSIISGDENVPTNIPISVTGWVITSSSASYLAPINNLLCADDTNLKYDYVYDMTAGTTYAFEVKHKNSTASFGDYTIMAIEEKEIFICDDELQSFSLDVNIFETPIITGQPQSFQRNPLGRGTRFIFRPEVTGRYCIHSTGNGQTNCWTARRRNGIDEDLGDAYDDMDTFSFDGTNFKIVNTFNAGTTYVFYAYSLDENITSRLFVRLLPKGIKIIPTAIVAGETGSFIKFFERKLLHYSSDESITNRRFLYSSNNSNVLEINNDTGAINAKAAGNNVKITITSFFDNTINHECTVNVVNTNAKGFIQLPESGIGFSTYHSRENQWGLPSTIRSLIKLGILWGDNDYGLLSFGNLSNEFGTLYGGRTVGHMDGKEFDMRPIRTDGQASSVSVGDTYYSTDRTREVIKGILATGNVDLIYFNDSILIKEFTEVRFLVDHANHLHVKYK